MISPRDTRRGGTTPECASTNRGHECVGEYIEYGRPARTTNLDHLARFLVNLGCPFLVRQPPELLDAIQRLGEQIAAMGKMQPDLPRAL